MEILAIESIPGGSKGADQIFGGRMVQAAEIEEGQLAEAK